MILEALQEPWKEIEAPITTHEEPAIVTQPHVTQPKSQFGLGRLNDALPYGIPLNCAPQVIVIIDMGNYHLGKMPTTFEIHVMT